MTLRQRKTDRINGSMNDKQKRASAENYILFQISGMMGNIYSLDTHLARNIKMPELRNYKSIRDKLLKMRYEMASIIEEVKTMQDKRKK